MLSAKFFQLPVKKINVPAQPLPVLWPLSQATVRRPDLKVFVGSGGGLYPDVSHPSRVKPLGQIAGPVLL